MRKSGYKELADAPCPEYDEATQYIETSYVDNDDFITKVHTVKEIEAMTE